MIDDRTHIQISRVTWSRIKQLSDTTGIKMYKIVEKAIDEYVQKKGETDENK